MGHGNPSIAGSLATSLRDSLAILHRANRIAADSLQAMVDQHRGKGGVLGPQTDPERLLKLAWEIFKVMGVAALGAFLANWDSRARRHHSALIRIEHLLNRHLNALSDARLHIRGTISSIDKRELHWGVPEQLDVDRVAYSDLANLDLINRLFGYNTSIDKLNHDTANLFGTYEELKRIFLEGKFEPETYWENCGRLATYMPVLISALEVQEEEAKTLLCRFRVQARRDMPWTGRLVLLFMPKSKVSENAVAAELVKLEAEIAQTKAASGHVIRERLAQAPTEA